ncbi:MAG TPA: imidazole glycerol phosphate synthase cyclase subunit [Myxococcota bacterium]|nr:imidazole glycerol phosphate synthase cyclase subunit [Myxococcota bacterium]
MAVRVIVRLDVKGPNLVKGIHLEGLRALGRPGEFARHYYEHGADELLYIDAVASLYGRNSLLEIVRSTSAETFVPLCVGGGLRSVEDIHAVLRAGADKVALNTRAIREPEFIRDAARRFGSSTIVISIQAMRRGDHYECFTDSGREATGKDALEWALAAEALGAGEILVTSIDREGTGEGYDLELTRAIAQAVSIPVIACGGAGSAEHVAQAVLEGRADAVCVAGLLHYGTLRDVAMAEPLDVGIGHAAEKHKRKRIEGTSLEDLKAHLRARGIDVREPAVA